MKLNVFLTQKAKRAFDGLTRAERAKALRFVNYLEVGNEKSVKSTKSPAAKDLYVGKLSSRVRMIYRKSEDQYEIIDFVNVDQMKVLANMSKGA
ncbi:hypothetical protein ACK1CN_00880 [Vibrio coralliilyticus]|uniref:hypothetical protein n=1 Tax=Vibrio coralliilyticus TaxID=190893 RepID=UPI0039175B81